MPVVDNKFERWDVKVHHPRERCEATVKTGQCPYKSANGTNHCVMHGANSGVQSKQVEAARNYRLMRWQNRVGELSESQNIKSLREEVGILRMILEEMLNQCETSLDLLLYSQKMSDLVMKIERLVVSCDKLENRMGLLLDKSSVLQLAATYVQIINNYVPDPEIIESISAEMAQVTLQLDNPVEDQDV
jgi:hypothetical protein